MAPKQIFTSQKVNTMKHTTLNAFIEYSYIPATLIRSTVRQCGGWQEFKDIAEDVCNHGANCGFNGFIYYTETCAFTKRNKKAIIELCKQTADDCYGYGYKSVSDFIGTFNCVDLDTEEIAKALYTGKGDNVTEVYNALAWYALEKLVRSFVDFVESEECPRLSRY